MKRFSRDDMARRVAQDIPEGAYVNLGIGLPTMVANHLDKSRDIFLHSENGILGMGPAPAAGEEDAYRASRAAAPAAAKPAATSAAKTKEERQARIDQAFKPPSDEQIQQGLEAGTLGAGLSLKKVADLAKNLANRRAATKNSLRLDRPGTVSGEGFVMRDGKIVKDIAKKAPQKALPSPITDVTPKTAKQMAETNLRERGNKFLFADDAMKRGGRVKKMASGGSVKSSVSSASRRGDGIALRGKTRGKMY